MFITNPAQPMMRTYSGFSIVSSSMNRCIACKKILIPSARRKTELKKAPSTAARCQPNVKCAGASLRFVNLTATRATMKVMTSFRQ